MENSHSNLIFKFDMHLFSDIYLEALLKGLSSHADSSVLLAQLKYILEGNLWMSR